MAKTVAVGVPDDVRACPPATTEQSWLWFAPAGTHPELTIRCQPQLVGWGLRGCRADSEGAEVWFVDGREVEIVGVGAGSGSLDYHRSRWSWRYSGPEPPPAPAPDEVVARFATAYLRGDCEGASDHTHPELYTGACTSTSIDPDAEVVDVAPLGISTTMPVELQEEVIQFGQQWAWYRVSVRGDPPAALRVLVLHRWSPELAHSLWHVAYVTGARE